MLPWLAAGCWLLAAGCWLLAAGCWLLAAGCCVVTTPFLLRADLPIILTTKVMSALWGVHLIAEVNRLMVSGRSVASEFLGFRRGSASKKTRHKPDKPDTGKRAAMFRPSQNQCLTRANPQASFSK